MLLLFQLAQGLAAKTIQRLHGTDSYLVLPQLVMENASVKLNSIAWRFFYGKESEAFFG